MGYKDVHVANTPDLRDGEMKEVSIDETRILLARAGDRFYAVSATCPHYGAPLVSFGPHVSTAPQESMQRASSVDAMLVGEPEDGLLALAALPSADAFDQKIGHRPAHG